VSSGLVWGFSGVYGPLRAVERRLMWEELAGVSAWWDVPWCVGGDFNTVRYPSKRVGSSSFSPSMQDFLEFISSMGFIDLPLEGGTTTWSNCRSKSRLDRYLVTPSLENHFSKLTQRRLPHFVSNHFPILLSCGFMQRGKSPFRFENMWLKGEGFMGRIQQWWNSYNVSGSPSSILVQKLRLLKSDLRRWNVEEFGDVNLKKNEVLLKIQDLERVEEQRPLSDEERVSQEQSKSEYENLLILEEIH
jgi:hypothetical protein